MHRRSIGEQVAKSISSGTENEGSKIELNTSGVSMEGGEHEQSEKVQHSDDMDIGQSAAGGLSAETAQPGCSDSSDPPSPDPLPTGSQAATGAVNVVDQITVTHNQPLVHNSDNILTALKPLISGGMSGPPFDRGMTSSVQSNTTPRAPVAQQRISIGAPHNTISARTSSVAPSGMLHPHLFSEDARAAILADSHDDLLTRSPLIEGFYRQHDESEEPYPIDAAIGADEAAAAMMLYASSHGTPPKTTTSNTASSASALTRSRLKSPPPSSLHQKSTSTTTSARRATGHSKAAQQQHQRIQPQHRKKLVVPRSSGARAVTRSSSSQAPPHSYTTRSRGRKQYEQEDSDSDGEEQQDHARGKKRKNTTRSGKSEKAISSTEAGATEAGGATRQRRRGGASRGRTHNYQATLWEQRYQDLKNYQSETGHCSVPHSSDGPGHAGLIQWIKRQRYQYKLKKQNRHSTLSDEREQALEDIDFIWDSHKVTWDERYAELVEFKEANGHCNVPSTYKENHSLSIWVQCQRRQYKAFKEDSKKSSQMSGYRIEKLEEIGFVWKPRGGGGGD